MVKGPLNSAQQATTPLAGGVYNSVSPSPADAQACALQLDSKGNLKVNVSVGSGVLSSPIPVELSDGSQAIGVATNPLFTVASNETSTIFNGATALVPKFGFANPSSTATIQAAIANKKLRVVAAFLMSAGTVNVKFQSHVTPTDISALYALVVNTGFVLPYNPVGWFETISGQALDLNLSGSIAVGVTFVYVEV